MAYCRHQLWAMQIRQNQRRAGRKKVFHLEEQSLDGYTECFKVLSL